MQNEDEKNTAIRKEANFDLQNLPQTQTDAREKEITAICPKCFKPHQAIHSLHGIQLLGCPMIEDDAVIFL